MLGYDRFVSAGGFLGSSLVVQSINGNYTRHLTLKTSQRFSKYHLGRAVACLFDDLWGLGTLELSNLTIQPNRPSILHCCRRLLQTLGESDLLELHPAAAVLVAPRGLRIGR